MAIFSGSGGNGNFLSLAFGTAPGSDLTVVTATASEVVLRNPLTGGLTILFGSGLSPVRTGGVLSVRGTVTGFEVRAVDGDNDVPAFAATGISWNAASLISSGRIYAASGEIYGFAALLSRQPVIYDAGNADAGVNFGFRDITSVCILTGSDFNDTLRGGRGDDTIRGGDGDDLILPGGNSRGDLIDAGSGFDTVDFSLGSTRDAVINRYVLSHRALDDRTGIVATLFGDPERVSVIDKGSFGETHLLGYRMATYGRGGLTIEGTALDDRFDLSEGFGFVNLVPGRGSDTVVATDYGHIGLDFATDSNGIAATQGAVVDLVTGFVANDGFGYVDRLAIDADIRISVTLTQWADHLVVREGFGVLRGGGGTDTLDFGQVGFAAGVRIDLAQGEVRGVTYGQSATGFENLIGTRDHGDRLSGTTGANVIEGLGGDDTIYGDGFRAAYAPTEAAQVWRLYQVALGRAPDPVGLNDWTERLSEGSSTLREVVAGFVHSGEFYRQYENISEYYLGNYLYHHVFDRAPGPLDQAYDWRANDLVKVILQFSESREFANKFQAEAAAFAAVPTEAAWTDDVFRLYQATLGRAPDAEGLVNWLGRLGGGMPFLTATEAFTERRAFQDTYGGLDDAAFVTRLYENVLDRAPDAGGLSDWLDRLASGTTRAEVVAGFAQSREFVNDTAAAATDFVRNLGGGDTIEGGAGQNVLWGGMLADEFVFDADDMAHHRVMDFEGWDFLTFRDFGYDDAQDIRARMTQTGADVVFQDQGVTVTLVNTQLAGITDDSLIFA